MSALVNEYFSLYVQSFASLRFQERGLKVQEGAGEAPSLFHLGTGHQHFVAIELGYTPVCKPETVDLCLCIGKNEIQRVLYFLFLPLFDNANGTWLLVFLSAFNTELEKILSLF